MDAKQAKVQLRNLREWREAYYNGAALVTDAVYDDVEDQVRSFAATLPDGDPQKVEIEEFLARVGAPIPDEDAVPADSKWVKVKHKAPMGSLNKAQVASELQEWGKQSAAPLAWSDKCDGISIALYYTAGELTQAVTRGDGEVGEDITRNVLKMKGIVRQVKGLDGFIRGEIVLRKSDWKVHFPEYANPRNAAAGISKRLDGKGCENLTVLHYQIIRFSGRQIPTKAAEFQILAALGAALPKWGAASTLADVEAVYQRYVNTDREALDYDIDGLVIEYNATDVKEALGEKNNRPAGAIAYKFPHESKVTTLRDISWQVGNTGRITPVAKFDAVKLAGASVTNASLHNISNIERLLKDIPKADRFYVGDQIVVSRRNDVIPYVEKIIASEADNGASALVSPTTCPACGTTLTRDGEFLVCPNDVGCPAQVAGAIKTWVTKIGLKGVGDTLIDTLCEQGIIKDAADLYTLDAGELADVRMDGRRVGGTSDIVMTELHAKKSLPLHVIVGSLNIPLCSRSTCKTLVDAGFDTLDKMRSATMAQIAAVPGMGAGRAASFVDGLKAREALIDKLIANGISVQGPSSGPMKGKSVCMTGFRDADMTAAIEGQGGTVKSSVCKGLSYLVSKEADSNSGKAQKARAQGTEIVSIEEMWTLLGGRP